MGFFGNAFSGWHLVIILLIVLLFGAAKLPALASSIGQSMRILKKESKADATDEPQTPELAEAAPTVAAPAARDDVASASPTGNSPHTA